MRNESNKSEDPSIEIYTINTQSSSSKQENVPEKFSRPKQWKNNMKNSLKHPQNVLNKTLVGGGDSLIQVNRHDYYLKSLKTKVNKHNDIITINVSGNRYQTRLSTLENYPNTLLGNKKKRKYYLNNETNEYFFDRHRACFEAILYYYQSNGRLRRPDYVPLDTFLEEILFFDLGSEAISQLNKIENMSIIKYIDLPNWHWRRYIWFYLEYPQNSIFSRIIHFISTFLTLLSCITLAIETLPKYKEEYNNICQTENNNLTLSINDTLKCSVIFSSPFFILQTICISYFTIEFLLRLISTPSYLRFILSIFNWIDLGVIVPYFLFLAFALNEKGTDLHERTFISLRMFRILRFLRVLKISLVFKQFKSLRVLSSTLKESFIDFILMIIILTLMAFLFGAGVYFAEQETNGDVFDSIPKATYWGIITIATVGYGDIYPITVVGRILACTCALFGLATTGMLISVLVGRYQRVYNRKKFYPEHIISAIDSSDSERDEKQDFLNRKLTGTGKTLSGVSNLPIKLESPLVVTKKNRRYSEYATPSSHVRFIITLTDDQINKKFMHQTAKELIKELTETIKTTGDRINLKLISVETDSSNNKSSTTNQLSSTSQE